MFRCFLQWKTKLETLWNSETHIICKKRYKNIDYWKLVSTKPVSQAASSNQWFIAEKTVVKNWALIKITCKNNDWKLNCDDKQKKIITVQGSSRNKVKREKVWLWYDITFHFSLYICIYIYTDRYIHYTVLLKCSV